VSAPATGAGLAPPDLSRAPGAAAARGEAILGRAFRQLQAARTFQARIATRSSDARQRLAGVGIGTVAAMKPNRFRLELRLATGGRVLYVADGHQYFSPRYAPSGPDSAPPLVRWQLPQQIDAFPGPWEGEVDAFFGGERGLAGMAVDHVGKESVAGVECDLVAVTDPSRRQRIYAVGERDFLIRRQVTIGADPRETLTNTLSGIRLDGPLSPALFAFTPPPGRPILAGGSLR
jgi:outer membrane lipoprotein-sorting protein